MVSAARRKFSTLVGCSIL